MSTSLRDQLLKAGLINKKQANEAERQLQRQERHPPKPGRGSTPGESVRPPNNQGAKAARDQALNRQQHEKAERKARSAQIKQLIEQNRLATVETEEFYNFVDGGKIRRIPVNTSIRERLSRGEIAIVRHAGRYDLVPHGIASRIRERDERAVIASAAADDSSAGDAAYAGYPVPDDLMW